MARKKKKLSWWWGLRVATRLIPTVLMVAENMAGRKNWSTKRIADTVVLAVEGALDNLLEEG
jgi:hypothetical protein